MSKQLRVLFLAADPRDVGYRPLLDEELNQIRKKIRTGKFRDALKFESEWSVKPADLQDYFSTHDPDIVHFSGHGNSKGIVLQNSFGRRTVVSKSTLASLFKVNKGRIRIVLLNACYSEPQARALSETIDFTIGMGAEVRDKAAITFAASFYQALANGKSVNDAFEAGKVQLKVLKIAKSAPPQLLVRKGADAFAPFLPQLSRKPKAEGMKRRKRKTEAPGYNDNIMIGGNVDKSVIHKGDGATINYNFSRKPDEN